MQKAFSWLSTVNKNKELHVKILFCVASAV